MAQAFLSLGVLTLNAGAQVSRTCNAICNILSTSDMTADPDVNLGKMNGYNQNEPPGWAWPFAKNINLVSLA